MEPPSSSDIIVFTMVNLEHTYLLTSVMLLLGLYVHIACKVTMPQFLPYTLFQLPVVLTMEKVHLARFHSNCLVRSTSAAPLGEHLMRRYVHCTITWSAPQYSVIILQGVVAKCPTNIDDETLEASSKVRVANLVIIKQNLHLYPLLYLVVCSKKLLTPFLIIRTLTGVFATLTAP